MKPNNRRTPPRCNKFVIVSCIAIVFSCAFLFLFIYDGYPQKIISRLNRENKTVSPYIYNDRALDGWANCLNQLRVNADIVFYGDSLTHCGNFDRYFPDKTVCNLGLGSNTLKDMIERVGMIESVNPKMIFVMGGINSLRDDSFDQTVDEYDQLLSAITSKNTAKVYAISILPTSKENTEYGCSLETIPKFNNEIRRIAEKYGCTYVDLYSSFVMPDGSINPILTTDGVHLNDQAYIIWQDCISSYIY